MTVEQILVLSLFCITVFVFLSFFIVQSLINLYLYKKVEKFISRIDRVNSKKINFKIKNAHVYAKNNKLYTDLIASWTVLSKEMRLLTSMATLHLKQLIQLISKGKIIEALRYTSTLDQSTIVFEEQWKLLENDVESFIKFASEPSSILVDLKQVYAEIVTLSQQLIGNKETKTSNILKNSSQLIETLFTKFNEVSLKGNYDHAFKIVVEIRNELKTLSETLNGVPYIAYLIGVIFKDERQKFKTLYKISRNEGIIFHTINPMERFKEIVKKVSSYNEAFLSKHALKEDVCHIMIDEIIKLSKLNVFIKAEIQCKERYFKWKIKILPWVKEIIGCWKIVQNQNYFKFYDQTVMDIIIQEEQYVKNLIRNDLAMTKSPTPPLYVDLLNNLIEIVKETKILEETLKENVSKALDYEKLREIIKNNLISSYKKINAFWKENASIPYQHIHDYFNEKIEDIKKKHIDILELVVSSMYREFDVLKVSSDLLIKNIEKLQWEVDTLINNENNIRKLYEIANRYRMKSAQVNAELDTAEKLIYNHNAKAAYHIISKVLKQYDPKDLKKYKVVVS